MNETALGEAELRRQYEARLRSLMNDVGTQWQSIDALAQRGTASGYEQAVRALVDLAQARSLTSRQKEFERALRKFLQRHAKRGALLRRLNAAMPDRDALAQR